MAMNKITARNNLLEAVKATIKAISPLMYALKYSPGQGLEEIRAEYHADLSAAMSDYFQSERPITAFRNEFRRAVNDAFYMTVIAGWADAGASGSIPDSLQSWLIDRVSQEISYADELFNSMRDLRALDDPDKDLVGFVTARADGYANTLTGIYAYAKMVAMKERPGKWVYGDTIAHCETCSGLAGGVHPLSWYISRGYIPQEAGSRTLACRGYHCDCTVIDPVSGEQLIP